MTNDPCNVLTKYDVGDAVKLATQFTDPDNNDAPVDPTKVYLEVTRPSGLVKTAEYLINPELVRDDVGLYHLIADIDEPGVWHYRWWSTGLGQSMEQRYFSVRATGPEECVDSRTGIQKVLEDSPIRVRGDQGEVQARSADDAIKLDQYQRKTLRSRFAIAQQSVQSSTHYTDCQ